MLLIYSFLQAAYNIMDQNQYPTVGGFRVEVTVEAHSFDDACKRAEELFAHEPSFQYKHLLRYYGAVGLERLNVAPEDREERLLELLQRFKLTAKLIPVSLYMEILEMATTSTLAEGYTQTPRKPRGISSETKRKWLNDFYNLLGVYGWDVSQL
ncbi:MAG TPA: hypothetical protein VGD26_06495 [Chitinophagaceae bacterium]